MKTKIFLDSGDPDETREALRLIGFLDGQTTNPTLVSKNPEVKKRLEKGEKFRLEEILQFYKEVVRKISKLIPDGSVSIEVYADRNTTSEQMLKQGRDMFTWIPNAHLKFPTTHEGLTAAEQAIKEGMRVNMTLCFSQEQAAAIYASTKGAKRDGVFVSPFIGRLDDRGENGMNIIENIIKMYKKGDHHVEVLTASVRNLDHFLFAIKLESDIVTLPFKVLKKWSARKMPLTQAGFAYKPSSLRPIPYQEIDLNKPWQEYNLAHELTDVGIEKFSADWNSLLK